MRFHEKYVIFNYQVVVTISEQAYDLAVTQQQCSVISQGFNLVKCVKKKSIQDREEQKEKSRRPCQLQYIMKATYTQVSLYVLCLNYLMY